MIFFFKKKKALPSGSSFLPSTKQRVAFTDAQRKPGKIISLETAYVHSLNE